MKCTLGRKVDALNTEKNGPMRFNLKPGQKPLALEVDPNVARVRLRTLSDTLQHLDDEAVHVAIIAKTLPKSDANRQRSEKMDKTLEALHEQADRVNHILNTVIEHEVKKTDTQSVIEDLGRQANDLENAMFVPVFQASQEIGALRKSIFDDAEVRRKREETYADVAWWSTATLFLIGWGLGLLGKVYGIRGDGAGE